MSVVNFLDSSAVSRNVTPSYPLPVTTGGTAASPPQVSTATLSNVASAASSTSLLASNTSRKGVLITNDDANTLYVKYGTTASTSSYTVSIAGGGGYWEMPQPIYTGAIDGIWSADGSGSARITEL